MFTGNKARLLSILFLSSLAMLLVHAPQQAQNLQNSNQAELGPQERPIETQAPFSPSPARAPEKKVQQGSKTQPKKPRQRNTLAQSPYVKKNTGPAARPKAPSRIIGMIEDVPNFERNLLPRYEAFTSVQKISLPSDAATENEPEELEQGKTQKAKLGYKGKSSKEEGSQRDDELLLPNKRSLLNITVLILLLLALVIFRMKRSSLKH